MIVEATLQVHHFQSIFINLDQPISWNCRCFFLKICIRWMLDGHVLEKCWASSFESTRKVWVTCRLSRRYHRNNPFYRGQDQYTVDKINTTWGSCESGVSVPFANVNCGTTPLDVILSIWFVSFADLHMIAQLMTSFCLFLLSKLQY